MADKWQLIHPNHINAIVDGYEATIEHFRDRVGFTLDRRIPDSGDGTDACLMTLGGVMFEFFAPKERGERGQGRLLSRYGDHYVGFEYHVPDVTSARNSPGRAASGSSTTSAPPSSPIRATASVSPSRSMTATSGSWPSPPATGRLSTRSA
jgi:hypothetical protein